MGDSDQKSSDKMDAIIKRKNQVVLGKIDRRKVTMVSQLYNLLDAHGGLWPPNLTVLLRKKKMAAVSNITMCEPYTAHNVQRMPYIFAVYEYGKFKDVRSFLYKYV